MSESIRIRPRDRDAILQSLSAGVVPRRGQQFIQVGRVEEVDALLRDIERIADGGSGIRFVIGRYGSGKTFFLQLIRSVGLEKGLVTMHADLNPDRRLHATSGQARNLFSELTRNLATRTHPEGGGLANLVERFITTARKEADDSGAPTSSIIRKRLESLSELVGGYDFASVVNSYWEGHESGNGELQASAVRWLRAEYTTKTDARRDLGVRTIVDDANFYDQLKLVARFVRLSGYAGLLVVLDEMVNLYKMPHTQARNSNYEQILRIVNDCLQGSVEGLGFLMGGTPEFLMDTRRGLYSYEALQTRLAENVFAKDGLRDFRGPVVRLPNLTPEELYVLLGKLRLIHANGDPTAQLLPDNALQAFMDHCNERIGASYFQTPRNTIKAFVQLLSVLEQNRDTAWTDLIGGVAVEVDRSGALDDPNDEESGPVVPGPVARDDGDLSSFQL